ncbi:MAG: endo-1,4-beta-xylanase [Spirochaetales bacterium]|nr:endo-1,4-beta-xylanase [Spirochaetales bacterium]
MKYVKYVVLYMLMLFFLLFSCVTTEEPAPVQEPTPKPTEKPIEIEKDIPGLKDVLKDDFLIGAAFEPGVLKSIGHQELIKKHFSSITAENCMKPISIHRHEDKFNFVAADALVEFAQANNIAVRGHTLIWHNQCPDWFFVENNGPASKETLRARMKTHITEIVKRYKGKIFAWDVVNEAIDTGYPDGYRRSKWYEILGPEYIELAFKYAREADPDAKLIYNDYNVTDFKKMEKTIEIVKDFKARGIPIDGVGMQMHINIKRPYLHYIEKALAELSELDIDIHVTELDINVYENERQALKEITPELLTEQGHRVKDIFTLFRKYNKHVTSVTFWGVADDYSWLQRSPVKRNNWPLVFDENLKAKPFYWGIVDPAKLSTRINKARVSEGTAVIDGKEDVSWEFTEFFPNIPTTPGLAADMKALWDKEYLYILLNITDKTPAQDDVITFFIDEKNNKADALDDNDRIIDFAINKSWKNSADAVVKKTDSGYIFETRLPFKTIKGEKDMASGFDMLIQSGDKTSIKWNDQKTLKDSSPKYWGVLECITPPKSGVAYYGTPVLDAEKDKLYKGSPFPVTLFIYGIQGEEVDFSGATGNAWVLWNEKALSVYFEVKDSVLSDASSEVYMQDSIEVFIDENNNKTTVYEKDDGQFRVNFKNVTSFGSTGSVDGFQSAAKIISGGYAVEVTIPFRTITGQENTIIGFDLQINDDQGNGKRDSISKWNDPSNDSWQSTAGFGVLILKK